MIVGVSIFLEFNLPNSTTWFYFSLLLAMALFFRFTRFFSVRNLDVVALFLLVPGLLLLLEAQTRARLAGEQLPAAAARLAAESAATPTAPVVGAGAAPALNAAASTRTSSGSLPLAWYGFVWLLAGSAFFFCRCIMDLALVSRPALGPNLNLSGLTWLGVALFVCLVVVAIRKPTGPPGPVGKPSVAVNETQRRADYLVQQDFFFSGLLSEDSSLWAACISAVICHLLIVAALVFTGWKHFQDPLGGTAAATFYLLLPYTAYHVDQVHHVLPTAFLLWAIAAYRLPMVAGLLLGLSAVTGYSALFLVFPWLSFYWRRGHGRFLLGFGLAITVCLAVIVAILWTNDDLAQSIQGALSLSDWQPWQQPQGQSSKGFWTEIAWAPAYRLPVFTAFAAFVLATTFWPSPKNLGHLIALSAAILIGIQFWFADQGGVYVLWYLPLLLLMVFRPNCSDRTAPIPTNTRAGWLSRLLRLLSQRARRLVRNPEPTLTVH